MIDFQTNTDQFEELKAAALMIGLSVFTLLALLVAAAVIITRWWMLWVVKTPSGIKFKQLSAGTGTDSLL